MPGCSDAVAYAADSSASRASAPALEHENRTSVSTHFREAAENEMGQLLSASVNITECEAALFATGTG